MNNTNIAQHYLTAAEQGDEHAQLNLSVMYANGQGGVEKDYIFAYKWANMAAMNGNEEASMLTELLMHYMTRQEIESSRKLTLQCRSNKL